MFKLKQIAVKIRTVFDLIKYPVQSSIVELKAKIKVTDWFATKHLILPCQFQGLAPSTIKVFRSRLVSD